MTGTADTNNTSDLLDQLRDIQEPLAPQGTPLWLIILTLTAAVLLIAAMSFQRYRRRYAFRHEALARIDKIAEDPNRPESLFELATLLRQLMRHRRGEAVNALDDQEWLSVLDSEFNSQWFSQGRGTVFGSSIYKRESMGVVDITKVCSDLKIEIRRLKPIASHN